MVNFEEAAELAKNFSKKPTDSEFLEFYGLFKQATVGYPDFSICCGSA